MPDCNCVFDLYLGGILLLGVYAGTEGVT